MKKLNITKEQFEKSRYFKNKYGKLEYVSESGNVFKTNKGKVLMFKESGRKFNEAIKDFAPGIQDWGTTIYVEPLGAELDWETVFSYVKHDCRQFPLLEQEIGVKPYETPSNRQIRNWIKKNPESFIDYLKECGYYDHLSELTAADDDSYDESTKKFSESSFGGMNDIQNGLAAALDAEIRNLKPEDVQFVSESAIDETSVGIIVSLLHSVLTSGELTEEQKMKLMDTKPALLKEMVLDLINKLLPKTQGYQVLALGFARAAVQEMTDVDWKDVLKYTLDNLDNL